MKYLFYQNEADGTKKAERPGEVSQVPGRLLCQRQC